MAFVLLGVLLLGAKLAEVGPVAAMASNFWSWCVTLLPFLLAAVWWQFADSIGLTQRRAMQKMEDRKAERREKALDALGIDAKRDRQVRRARDTARRIAADAEPPPPPTRLNPEPPPAPEPEVRREPRL